MDAGSVKNTDTVEMDIPEPGTAVPSEKKSCSQKSANKPLSSVSYVNDTGMRKEIPLPKKTGSRTYSPENGLIDRVTVLNWHTDYSYYEQFRATALRLRDYDSEPCAPVPFFSYMPQYSQMTADQLRFYLYVRGEICEGRYPDTEYTYLLLLIYETINLSDVNAPEYTMTILCNLLCGYAGTYERLILQLGDWICDFALISGVMPPREKLAPFIGKLSDSCYLKEFYIGLGKTQVCASDILKYSSAYNYTKSRYATGENRALYDRHISAVLEKIVSAGAGAAAVNAAMLEKFSITRDSYVGALCSPFVKKRLEISYFSFSKSHELRFLITDILKYTENHLRQSLGIRSRLSVGKLPENIKKIADDYFRENLPNSSHGEDDSAAYEKLYEPAPSKLTPEAARAIEEKSWQTTERLLEAFGGTSFDDGGGNVQSSENKKAEGASYGASKESGSNESASAFNASAGESLSGSVPSAKKACIQTLPSAGTEFIDAQADGSGEDNPDGGLPSVLNEDEKSFVRAALACDRALQKSIAKQAGLSPSLMADAINAKAADEFGDIILEEKDGAFCVLEDYYDEISSVKL